MATAINMVNRIQRALRLPLSGSVTDTHGALILEHINTAQRSLLLDACVWDELKLYGEFNTEINSSLYTIQGGNSREIDQISNLQIENYDPLIRKEDEDFRELKRSYGTQTGRPLYYRMYSRIGGAVEIEVCPTPDAVYTIDSEALCKPKRLKGNTDETVLDDDLIFLGAFALAKDDQGQDATTNMNVFTAKLLGDAGAQGGSNWGDVEPV